VPYLFKTRVYCSVNALIKVVTSEFFLLARRPLVQAMADLIEQVMTLWIDSDNVQ